jgi:SNF family Na+-dependent transporter
MDQDQVSNFFTSYTTIGYSTTGIPYEAVIFYLLCLILNTYILSRGLKGGVEKVAKIGIPLLLLFGVFLAIRGITLGSTGAPEGCTDCDSLLGLNFLWEPQFDSLLNPNVWLAAAGQIFFTLSVGMGTIHCYASYIRPKDDIALNAMSAGWMNGFVEIVLGASIVIPIAVGYLGLDWVKENAGFAMAFQTMPFLFEQWGDVLATVAGFFWFGLLFFAGITSSLAMGTPWMGFMADEFGWRREKAAWSFGGLVLLIGLPTVFFFAQGVFDEYDYWAGTVSLVVFALAESIIFSWIFGMDRSWTELNRGADLKVPGIYKPIIKYITPSLILIIFLVSLVTPLNNDWNEVLKGNWQLDPSSIIGKISNKGVVANRDYFADFFESEVEGTVVSIHLDENSLEIAKSLQYFRDMEQQIQPVFPEQSMVGDMQTFDSLTVIKKYTFDHDEEILVREGENVQVNSHIARGSFINNIFYIDMARLYLVLLFLFICFLVYKATKLRERNGSGSLLAI